MYLLYVTINISVLHLINNSLCLYFSDLRWLQGQNNDKIWYMNYQNIDDIKVVYIYYTRTCFCIRHFLKTSILFSRNSFERVSTCVSFELMQIVRTTHMNISFLSVNFRVNFLLIFLQNREITNKISKIQVDLVHVYIQHAKQPFSMLI